MTEGPRGPNEQSGVALPIRSENGAGARLNTDHGSGAKTEARTDEHDPSLQDEAITSRLDRPSPDGSVDKELDSSPLLLRFLSGVFQVLPVPILGSLLTFLGLWFFVIFPGLRPWQPPDKRDVTVANVVAGEPLFLP